ncbi:MAG: thioredoxin family protein [Kiritimatiellales bacterium]|nr:thioredoxin family protein [Kiritimatiellales bacterium]
MPKESPVQSSAHITNGMTAAEVIAIMGLPKGVGSAGSARMLVYDGGFIQLTDDGRVENIDPDFEANVYAARKQMVQMDKVEEKKKSKGLVLFEGQWVTAAEKQRVLNQRRMQAANRLRAEETLRQKNQPLVLRNKNGDPIDHGPLLTQDKVTILIFYGNWSITCKNMIPTLVKFAHDEKDVVFKKVDIRQWNSPVAKQYGVVSVPDVRVFDQTGQLVGPPTRLLSTVYKYVETAK